MDANVGYWRWALCWLTKTRTASPLDDDDEHRAAWSTAPTMTNGQRRWEWIGGAGNNQPTKYWLDRAASLAATDEKNEADGAENAKNGQ